jgi:membrane protein
MPAKHSIVNLWHLLKESARCFLRDEGLRMSAAIAYYAAFSMAPLLLIAVAIAGFFFGEEAVRGTLEGELRNHMGPSASYVVQDLLANARRPGDNVVTAVVGVGLLLVGAGAVFAQLQAALNIIWNVEPPPSGGIRLFIRNRLLSFSMVLVTGFLLLVSMLLNTLLQAFGELLGEKTGVPTFVWLAGSGILSFLVTVLLLAAIFKILPNVALQWRNVWAGAVFTAVLFMLGSAVISWYLGRQATASSYGSAGAFAVMLMWLYYSSIILLFGAEFTRARTRPKPA